MRAASFHGDVGVCLSFGGSLAHGGWIDCYRSSFFELVTVKKEEARGGGGFFAYSGSLARRFRWCQWFAQGHLLQVQDEFSTGTHALSLLEGLVPPIDVG